MNEKLFRSIYRELIDENPVAMRAVLKILKVEFTDQVPSLSVTCEKPSRLRVNLDFLRENCRTEAHVKAVLIHEFLHVLLRHTETYDSVTPALHLATDSVINAIIHRKFGEEYSSLFSSFYADVPGYHRLLRPMTTEEEPPYEKVTCFAQAMALSHKLKQLSEEEKKERSLKNIWQSLYEGSLMVEDIRGLAEDLQLPGYDVFLIGNHEELGKGALEEIEAGPDVSPAENGDDALKEALGRVLETMDQKCLWNDGKGRGSGGPLKGIKVRKWETSLWKEETLEILKSLLVHGRGLGRKSEEDVTGYLLPYCSESDRRAALRSLWSTFLPVARWEGVQTVSSNAAQVYLDVSGSMEGELEAIVCLLSRLSQWIRKPLLAFSTTVSRAKIHRGELQTDSTGGTSINCVLEHIAKTRPRAALIVTDGEVEEPDPQLLEKLSGVRLHAIITSGGSSLILSEAGIETSYLGPSTSQQGG
ncbi:MAG: hypothetical protein QF492_09365 [Candidatus Krumholzibacteria bacterium]|nr:hypothetical protein [Candidatus Krumholzibacteria bacterium]